MSWPNDLSITAGMENSTYSYKSSSGGGGFFGKKKTESLTENHPPDVKSLECAGEKGDYVNDISGQLKGQGYTTSSGGFYSSCGSTICYPDITYSAPGSNKITGVIEVIEVKTGGAEKGDSPLFSFLLRDQQVTI